MVSQSQNDEWENRPKRTGSTLSVDCRQPPAGLKTPPSYFDAVRSRHSLSQPESVKLEKPLDLQQIKYNSLPRPLPQRLQVCHPNELDNHYKPPIIRQTAVHQDRLTNTMFNPSESNSGFQVYAKPPGPANHVPLTPPRQQFPGMSSSSSLPRYFPRGKMEVFDPANTRDMQQPLSVIVKQNEYDMNHHPGNYQMANSHANLLPTQRRQPPPPQHQVPPPPPGYRPAPMPMDGVNGRYPVYQNHTEFRDPRNAPRNQNHQVPINVRQLRPDVNSPAFRPPRYSREGTVPALPQRKTTPEPAVSIRTGPLGSYPDSRPVHPNSLPPESIQCQPVNHQLKTQNASAFEDANHRGHMKQSGGQNRAPLQHNGVHKRSPSHEPYKNGYHPEWYDKHFSPPHNMPRRHSNHENPYQNHVIHPPSNDEKPNQRVLLSSSNKQHEISGQKYDERLPNGEFYMPGKFQNSGHKTPEEAGLVMIVESRDLSNQVNSVAKDVVKPTPRMPLNVPRNGNIVNGPRMNNYHNRPQDCYSDPQHFPPGLNYLDQYGTDVAFVNVIPNGNPEPSCGKIISSRNSKVMNGGRTYENSDMYQAVPTNQLKHFNGQLLRNTPMSSSTASLSSEISSVSSPNRRSQIDVTQRRYQNSRAVVNQINGIIEAGQDKKNEISPSPWTREEREELQKQQVNSARRARDEEIENLESLPERSNKQEELLRILRLEREFQRRAEEIGDDDEEDEEDETLLERADHRERILLLEKEKNKSAFRKTDTLRDANITSSSDQWLANSQAKHVKKQSVCNGSATNSFEVDQFNDLLKTMNVSPISRDNQTEDLDHPLPMEELDPSVYSVGEIADVSGILKGRKLEKHQYLEKPVPAPRPGKSLSPVPEKTSLYGNLDFCNPLDTPIQQQFTNEAHIETENEYANIYYSGNTTNDYSNTNGNLPKRGEFSKTSSLEDVFLSKVDEKHPSKVALRVPLNVAAKDCLRDQQPPLMYRKQPLNGKVGEFVRSMSQDILTNGNVVNEMKKTLNSDLRNGCLRKTVTSPSRRHRPVSDSSLSAFLLPLKSCNGHSKEVNDNLDGKTSEYKKIWNSRPEKLTFLDKIRKFSLQAGEDDAPKDKVKNSRAQRELEIKFNGEIVTTEQNV